MTEETGIRTVNQRLAEAVEIGTRMRAIRGEWQLWVLSRAAWDRLAIDLAPAMPTDAWLRLAKYPALRQAIQTRAELWVNGNQDRPATYNFAMGDRDPVVHAELMASGLSVEDSSRLASGITAEMRDPSSWGTADSLEDGPAALAPHEERLARLDAELFRLASVPIFAWVAGLPVIRHGEIEIEIRESTVRRLATELAERQGQRVTLAA